MKLKCRTVFLTLNIDNSHLHYFSTFTEILLKWFIYMVLMKCCVQVILETGKYEFS